MAVARRTARSEFEKRVAAARKLASEARRYAWAKTAAEKAKGRRLEQEAVQALYAAATVWPDTILREFMAATLDLRAKNFERAEQRFERCIEAEPLVGAFHQGRGIALIGLRQHLEALEEFIVCLQLREDSFASLHFLQEAMKVTPGAEIKDPVYLGAKQLLAEYETPSRTYRSYGKGVAWLMPRRAWQARDDTIFTPPYDRLVSKQALGVPLTEGVLLVDADAIAGAELIYVQAGGDQFVLADPIRSYSMGKSEIPLTAIRVSRVSFTPVAVDKPAELKVGQLVTIRAANLYRQMGTDLRTGTAEVTAAGPEGVSLTKTLLPGEPVGAAFAGEAFAGFLTARCQPEGDGCGKSTFIQPSKLSEWAGRIKRTVAGRAGYRPYGRPKLKESVEAKPVDGQVFLVHILLGEKPPKEFGK